MGEFTKTSFVGLGLTGLRVNRRVPGRKSSRNRDQRSQKIITMNKKVINVQQYENIYWKYPIIILLHLFNRNDQTILELGAYKYSFNQSRVANCIKIDCT